MATVEKVLDEIGLNSIPRLLVFNKMDLCDPIEAANIARRFDAVPVSAVNQTTLGALMKELEKRLWPGEALDMTAN